LEIAVNVRTPAAVTAALAALALAGSALAGCSSPQFKEEKLPQPASFRTGSCAAAAEDTVALGRFTQRNRTAKELSDADRTELKTRQGTLVGLRSTLEDDLREPMEKLIVAVGFVRIRADSNTYTSKLLSDVDKARRAVQTVCVPA
jgi:hypothetical protein